MDSGDVAVGTVRSGGPLLTESPPSGAMLDDPVQQGLFETNVVPYLFTLNPFMAKYLFALG